MLNFHTLNITYNKYMTISICMGLKHRYGDYVEPQLCRTTIGLVWNLQIIFHPFIIHIIRNNH